MVLAEVDGEECTIFRCRAHDLLDGYFLRPISLPLFARLTDIVETAVRDAMGPDWPYTVCSRPWRENVKRGILLWVVGWVVIHSLTGTYLTRRVSIYGSLSTMSVPLRDDFVAGLVGVEVPVQRTAVSYVRAMVDAPESRSESVCKVVVIRLCQVVEDGLSWGNVSALDQG